MKFNKKTLAESITSELSGNKHFTIGKKQNVVITEAQLERLIGSNGKVNKKVVNETIDDVIREAYSLINECIISESIDGLDVGNYILNEQGQYDRNPGVAAGEGLGVVIDSIKKAWEMIKDSDMRKKIENTLVKLNNFATVTAELMQSGAPGGHAPRHTDKITDEVPFPELEEGEVVETESTEEVEESEEMSEGAVCEHCGEFHEGGCGHHVPVEDDMFDATEDDGDFFDDEEDGFNQDEVQFEGFGFTESKEKSEKELIAEDIKKMKQIIKPISKS